MLNWIGDVAAIAIFGVLVWHGLGKLAHIPTDALGPLGVFRVVVVVTPTQSRF